MNRPLLFLMTMALALCLCSLPTETDAQVFCRNGVCYNVGVRAANVVRGAASFARGTVYNTRSFVSSAPIVRRGLFGRRFVSYTPSMSSSYSSSYGSAGAYGATSYGSSGSYGSVNYDEPVEVIESPYSDDATTTKSSSTTRATGGCDCAERWEALEERLEKLEQPWKDLETTSKQPAWEKRLATHGKSLDRAPKWEQRLAKEGRPLDRPQLVAMK